MKKPYSLRPGTIFVIASLIAVLLPLAAENASAQDVLSVTNGIYRLFVNNTGGAGMFTVSTGDSHPFPGQSILYGGAVGSPGTSYLTIRSYTSDTDYVSTSDTGLSGSFTIVSLGGCSPVVSPTEGMGFTTTWSCNEDDILTIDQVTEIEGTTINDSFVRITTTVSNRSEAPAQIGIRYMWDWMIDGSDDSMLKRHQPDDPGFTSTFFEVAPPQFEYYEETNTTPTFSIFATVNGPASLNPPPTPPDRFNYSRWDDAFSNTWDFPVTGGNTDSATCYFWGNSPANAITLERGQSYSVTQYMTTFEQSIALTISGVVQSGGVALAGVSMGGLPGSPTTDINGYYEESVPYGWSGTVTPTKEGYSFAPASRSYTNVISNQPNQDYSATANDHTISGHVRTSDLSGIGGVMMNGLPGTPTTDNNGYYEATVSNGWSGAVTPSKSGHLFDPASRAYSNLASNKTEQNYTGTLLTFNVNASVSGGHGTVDPASQIVSYGGTATINIHPDPGYHIASILDNGTSKAIVNPYVITTVREDHTVVITFELDPILSVTPLDGLFSSGTQGGPFDPASKSYSVGNAGGGNLNWTASVDQSWVTVSSAGGTNSGTVTVSINSNANSLPGSPGGALYTATVTFNSNGGSTTRQVDLTVYRPVLSVSPPEDLNSSGNEGGPFDPVSKDYSVSNPGGGELNWTVSADQSWVTVSPATGTNSGTVTVSINTNASSLPGSLGGTIYNSTVTFSSNGGSTTRQVTLTVYRSLAYITNAGEDTVSVIEIMTNRVLSKINVGQRPLGVVANAQRTAAYVTNYDSDDVSVIDIATDRVIGTVKVGSNPVGTAIDKAGSTLFVVNYKSNNVSVIDTATNQVVATVPVGSEPCGVAVGPDGGAAYVTNYRSGTVSVIKKVSSTYQVIARIKVGSGPYGIAVHPDGSTVYVANYAAGTVSVINTATNRVASKVKVGGRPAGVTINPAGTFAYVTKNEGEALSVIDTTTRKVVGTVKVGRGPFGIATNANGTRIFVANSGDNTVSIIHSGDYGTEATVPVGERPVAFGDFVVSREGGGPTLSPQSRGAIPALEGENPVPKHKVRPPSHPPHVE